jgi:hypothetical protein
MDAERGTRGAPRSGLRSLTAVRAEATTVKINSKRAHLYIVEQGLRPAKSYENGSELKYAGARGGEIDDAMEKPRPIYCLIRSMRFERMTERRLLFPFGGAAIARDPD